MAAVLVAGCLEEPPPDEEDGGSTGEPPDGSTGEPVDESTGGDSDGDSDGDGESESESESEGEGDSEGDSESEPQCVDYGEPCTECEMAACGDLFCDCYGNPDCGLVAQCVLLCEPDDLLCIGGCATAYPSGTSDSALLADCAAQNCQADCEYLGTLPPPLTACERCVYAECGPETDACFGVADCPALLACVAACGVDTICQTGCGLTYPGAVAAATVVGDCSLAHCTQECS